MRTAVRQEFRTRILCVADLSPQLVFPASPQLSFGTVRYMIIYFFVIPASTCLKKVLALNPSVTVNEARKPDLFYRVGVLVGRLLVPCYGALMAVA